MAGRLCLHAVLIPTRLQNDIIDIEKLKEYLTKQYIMEFFDKDENIDFIDDYYLILNFKKQNKTKNKYIDYKIIINIYY